MTSANSTTPPTRNFEIQQKFPCLEHCCDIWHNLPPELWREKSWYQLLGASVVLPQEPEMSIKVFSAVQYVPELADEEAEQIKASDVRQNTSFLFLRFFT